MTTQTRWTVATETDGHSTDYVVDDANGRRIATLWDGLDDKSAALIAAAPELFSALCLMLAQFADHEQYDDDGYDTDAINAARAAIARATGN